MQRGVFRFQTKLSVPTSFLCSDSGEWNQRQILSKLKQSCVLHEFGYCIPFQSERTGRQVGRLRTLQAALDGNLFFLQLYTEVGGFLDAVRELRALLPDEGFKRRQCCFLRWIARVELLCTTIAQVVPPRHVCAVCDMPWPWCHCGVCMTRANVTSSLQSVPNRCGTPCARLYIICCSMVPLWICWIVQEPLIIHLYLTPCRLNHHLVEMDCRFNPIALGCSLWSCTNCKVPKHMLPVFSFTW